MKKLVVSIILLSGCSKELSVKDTPQPISYHLDVQPLIEMYCISCHQAGSPSAELFDYEHVSTYATSGELAGCLNGDTNYIQMPLVGATPMDPYKKYTILKWIEEGFDNN